MLKTLQVMTEKGLVVRNEEERAHVYTPAYSEEDTQRTMITDLVQRVYSGSAQHLVMRALQAQPASQEERDAIRKLLDEQEQEK